MSLSFVLFLFLTHLGVGVAFTLLLVSREAGVKFFRFNGGLAVVVLAIGLAFRPESVAAAPNLYRLSTLLLAAATGALVLYWATVGRVLAKLRRLLLWAGVVGGAAALVAQAVVVGRPLHPVMAMLTVASFLSSAALLGGSCTSMILGHWYLVLPAMNVSLLQSMVRFHIASTLVRVAVVAAAVFMAIAGWQLAEGPGFERYILSTAGVFFWQRVLFGLGGPVVLSYLTWETAKIRATQSATGILYVDLFTVVVGEVLAKYLLLATNVPV